MFTQEQVMAAAKKWRSIYPAYIDSSLKMSEGRRLGLQYCVQYPTLLEISEVLQKLQLQHLVEGHKIYSRDVLKVGRIKVLLATEDGRVVNPEVQNKWGLLKKVAAGIKANTKRKAQKPAYRLDADHEESQQQNKKIKKKK